jgi:SAM-dependent methyltransferase
MRPRGDAEGVSPRFLALLEAEGLDGRRVLDVGCGGGRLSLWLAQRAGSVVGVDRDAEALDYARRQAEAAGMSNVVFVEMDADRAEYVPFEPEMIVAHLFVSDAMMARAGRALRRGQCLALVAIHVDQWRETGRASRFAYDEGRMVETLRREGFLPEVAEVERRERRFASAAEALDAAAPLVDRWQADGRWDGYRAFVERGGRTLTESHLVVKARRG